jgi:hypothetical protein
MRDRSNVLTRSFRPTANSSSNTPAWARSASIGVRSIPSAANTKPDAKKPTSGGRPMRETASPSSSAPAIQIAIMSRSL